MRALKWIGAIAVGIVLLLVAFVLVVTLLVDPNRFKGRIEAAVQEATGQPLRLQGDLDIAWYPWLAVRTGPAQFGEPVIVHWQSAHVGAKLVPLLRGQLIVSRVRLDGLQVRLVHDARGRGNWEALLSQRGGAGRSPQIGGVEIRNGGIEYIDERSGTRLRVSNWQLDMGEWQSGEPFALQTRLNLADAEVEASADVSRMEPLRAAGEVSVEAPSLRQLFADLALDVPRPRDATALGRFILSSRWTVDGTAVLVKPLEIELDETQLAGELSRSADAQPVWTFALRGDRIDLKRYVDVEDDGKPFELPTEALEALRVRGELSFDEARLDAAQMKEVRLRVELEDGQVLSP